MSKVRRDRPRLCPCFALFRSVKSKGNLLTPRAIATVGPCYACLYKSLRRRAGGTVSRYVSQLNHGHTVGSIVQAERPSNGGLLRHVARSRCGLGGSKGRKRLSLGPSSRRAEGTVQGDKPSVALGEGGAKG